MTPLIDVTNTVGQDSPADNPTSAALLRRPNVKVPRVHPNIPDGACQGEVGIAGSVMYSKVRSEAAAIKMCNTQVSGPFGCASTIQGPSVNQVHQYSQSAMRVPPLPLTTTDVLLSQAVQALSLNPLSTQKRPRNRRRLSRHHRKSGEQSEKSTEEFQSCSGTPENSGESVCESAPQQCGACGLEFTSLSVLTQHLARHVYDGLYAAQWLTQAMNLVLSRRETAFPDSAQACLGGDENPPLPNISCD